MAYIVIAISQQSPVCICNQFTLMQIGWNVNKLCYKHPVELFTTRAVAWSSAWMAYQTQLVLKMNLHSHPGFLHTESLSHPVQQNVLNLDWSTTNVVCTRTSKYPVSVVPLSCLSSLSSQYRQDPRSPRSPRLIIPNSDFEVIRFSNNRVATEKSI